MTDAEWLYRRGTELLQSDPEEAIRYLSKSLERNPNAPTAVYNRATAYASLGRDREALADLDRLYELNPRVADMLHFDLKASAAPYTDVANSEYEAGNFGLALNKYESALAYDPEYANAWVGKGLALKALGQLGEVETCYDRAIELEPDNYFAWINLAELLHETRSLNRALNAYARAIAIVPDDADAYIARAEVYRSLGDDTSAANDVASGESLKSGSPPGN